MNVLSRSIRLDQLLIPGQMRQDPQLDLGVVRIHQHTVLLRHKYLADPSSQFHAHGNILQIWLRRTDSSRGRYGLVKVGVDPIIFPDVDSQSVGIGGLQLAESPILQNFSDDRMFVR